MTTRHGVEHFPSLVSAALAQREPEWRRLEAKREAKGSGGFRGYIPTPRRAPPESVAKVLALRKKGGLTIKGIAREVHMSPNTVRRIIREAGAGGHRSPFCFSRASETY